LYRKENQSRRLIKQKSIDTDKNDKGKPLERNERLKMFSDKVKRE